MLETAIELDHQGYRVDSVAPKSGLVDPFGRAIDYLRVSVTDRCDFRCTYCMAENMTFLPKKDLLTIDELGRLCEAFIARGVRRIRLTGGEPLVRKNVMSLFSRLGARVGTALEELTLTTNGSQLSRHARELFDCGVRRINVSLDTLEPEKFRKITRWGDIKLVLKGIEAAQRVGLKVKINVVALKGLNEIELPGLLRFAHAGGMDITFIETMPMGEVDEDRTDRYLPLSRVRETLQEEFTLTDIALKTGGPARYVSVGETGGRVGFITPMTHNFCESCNRVRLTCTGTLYMCLGQNDAADLRAVLREGGGREALDEAIERAIALKPRGHDFVIGRSGHPSVTRHMSMTGG